MEKELNIAAILKEKPNARIYDLLHNIYVKLDNISTTDKETVIWCTKEYTDKTSYFGYSELGTERGWLDGLQILKPSEEMQDWSKFVWKKGDILLYDENKLCIFDKWANEDYTEIEVKYAMPDYGNAKFKTSSCYKETNEFVIKKYVNIIELTKGGKLNLETLQIEEPKPEFKNGDIVHLNHCAGTLEAVFIFKNMDNFKIYDHASLMVEDNVLYTDSIRPCAEADVLGELRPATDSEKKQLFDALAKENKKWDADKKMLVDLPKKREFKVFQQVLVRDLITEKWIPAFFVRMREEVDSEYIYKCLSLETAESCGFRYCIPYNDQTKHLLGTTDEWKGGER